MNQADALLLGRKTYQGFAATWPSMTGMNGLADRMNSMPKFVVSTTLSEVEWNASLLHGDSAQAVGHLRESGWKWCGHCRKWNSREVPGAEGTHR